MLSARKGVAVRLTKRAWGNARTTFCQLQLEIWNALDAELAEFIRKTNHEARGEKFGAERDAWERAIALTSGPQPAAKSGRGGLTQAAT